MDTLDVTTSQTKPCEELGQETENIWGQILHNENGEKVLINLPKNNTLNNKLQAVNFRDTHFEEERIPRRNNRVIFIQPREGIASFSKAIIDKPQTCESNTSHTHAASTYGLSLPECEASYPEEENYCYRTHYVFVYGADRDGGRSRGGKDDAKLEVEDPDVKLNRKHAKTNLCKTSQLKFQQQTNTTGKQEILTNTRSCIPCSKQATKLNQRNEPNSKALRQNWFTKSSTEPVKPDKQESYTVGEQTLHHENLAKRIKNALLPKTLMITPGFKAASKSPVLELDNIGRTSETREIDDSGKQPSRQRVSKIFGINAQKYAVFDEVKSTKVEEINVDQELVDDRGEVIKKNADTGRSKWSKCKFWKTGSFLSGKNASSQVRQFVEVRENDVKIDDKDCTIKRLNKNAPITDHHQMIIEQEGSEYNC